MSADPYSSCLPAAHHYIARRVAVVPMRPALSEGRGGKPSPIPWIRWQAEGPLRHHREVEEFWAEHPSAQLAILLGKDLAAGPAFGRDPSGRSSLGTHIPGPSASPQDRGSLAAIDVDLKHLDRGRAPPGLPIPAPFPGGYVESTKSGGLHYLLRFREPLDPNRAERITGLGGYVDVFHGGLLIVAPSKFEGAPQGYAVLTAGGIPVFRTLCDGLAASAPWLAEAWEERWLRSKGNTTVSRPQDLAPGGADGSGNADPREVERALDAIRADGTLSRLFSDGACHPNGRVDRSLTEFRIAAFMKQRGFSREATWEVVKACAHTKSPRDPRGRRRFETQVWERLTDAARAEE